MATQSFLGKANFIGVDLAWSDRNPTGLAHLTFDGRWLVLQATERLTADGDLLSWISKRSNGTTWLGIDAPFIAPNPSKTSRPVDKEITSRFGRYHAGVYPGNRERCARAIIFGRKLRARGFTPDPSLFRCKGKKQLEIFPHLVQLTLFGKKKIIKYKKGSVAVKRKGLRVLQNSVAHYWDTHVPPCRWSRSLEELLRVRPKNFAGSGLKGLEDRIDALLCAYMSFYYWRWGKERCRVFGDLKLGYIIGPTVIDDYRKR